MTTRLAILPLVLLSLTALATPSHPASQKKSKRGNTRYIVVFKDDAVGTRVFDATRRMGIRSTSAQARTTVVAAMTLNMATTYGLDIRHTYSHSINGFSANVPKDVLERIRNDERVDYVEEDLPVHKYSQELPTGILRMQVDQNPMAAIDGFDDRVDVDVAVIDTGVDTGHPDLNVYKAVNFSDEDHATDGDGHGTHVSGTIGALDNNFGVVGVAPGARIWGVKVLDDKGSGSISDIVKGIDFVTENATEIEVANLSLGAQGVSRALHTALKKCTDAGVFVAVAAGNESSDVYGSDGVYGTYDDFIPASYPEVAAISALADSDGIPGGYGPKMRKDSEFDDSLATFSNFSSNAIAQNPVESPGAAIDFAAPGVMILSTFKDGAYAQLSGTSMASPHATGLAALYIATYGRAFSAYGVNSIRQILIDTSVDQKLWNSVDSTRDPDSNPEGLANAKAISSLDY